MKRKFAIAVGGLMLVLAVSLCGCRDKSTIGIIGGADGPTAIFVAKGIRQTPVPEPTATEPTATELAVPQLSEQKNLTQPPLLQIRDERSGASEEFTVAAGNYLWSCDSDTENTDGMELAACGAAPLEQAETAACYQTKEYQGGTSCQFLWEVMPDCVRIHSWQASDAGNADAVPVLEAEYGISSSLSLKPNHIYEVTAEWLREAQVERGFSGEASYVFRVQ